MPASATKEKNSTKKSKLPAGRYIETVGRRKTAVARVRIYESGKQSFSVNDKELEEYFPVQELQVLVKETFKKAEIPQKFKVTAKITGGGISSQSQALRHGIARALILYDQELRKKLKKAGFLKRDPRIKERKKFGLKKARKAAQWSKR